MKNADAIDRGKGGWTGADEDRRIRELERQLEMEREEKEILKNAMAESFFATLECELPQRTLFDEPVTARREIFGFIEGFYNTRRLHSSLD